MPIPKELEEGKVDPDLIVYAPGDKHVFSYAGKWYWLDETGGIGNTEPSESREAAWKELDAYAATL